MVYKFNGFIKIKIKIDLQSNDPVHSKPCKSMGLVTIRGVVCVWSVEMGHKVDPTKMAHTICTGSFALYV